MVPLSTFLDLTFTGLVIGAIYALFALGYTLVYGVLRLINFAHSEVFMWGSFGAVWAMTLLGAHSGMGWLRRHRAADRSRWSPPWLVSGGVALVVERIAYRRLREKHAPPLVALISAIGASFMLSEIMGLRDRIAGWVGLDGVLGDYVRQARENTSFPNPLPNVQVFAVGGFEVRSNQLIVLVAAILMMVALDQFVSRSRLGRGVRAVSQDPEAAALMGVNQKRVVQLTFFIGGLMAGAAALLYLLHIGVTRYNVGFILGIKAFTAAVLGGIGNIRGALRRRSRPRPGRELRHPVRAGVVVEGRRVVPAPRSSSCCSGPPASSASPSGRPAHEHLRHAAKRRAAGPGDVRRPLDRPCPSRPRSLVWVAHRRSSSSSCRC